jgi:UPF0716 protein FxsA
MLAPLVILFIAVPIVELYVLIQVGGAIGVLPTIALLLADSILGGMLMRSQGRAAWRRFNAAVAEGRPPAREVLDGALIIFGGALLLTPGFFTDVLGLILLLPPTRALVRRLLVRHFAGRMLATVVRPGAPAGMRGGVFFDQRPSGRGRDPRFDVEGEASEVDRPPRELP